MWHTPGNGGFDIWVMNDDGTGKAPIANGIGVDADGDFALGDTALLYDGGVPGADTDIWWIPPGENGGVDLTNAPGNDRNPSY